MKAFLCLIIFMWTGFGAIAQDDEITVEWAYSVSSDKVSPGDEVDLIFKAVIPQNWYLYSTDFSADLGPKVTAFTFLPNDTYELIGEVVPVNPKKKYDDIWEGEYTYFIEGAEFRQRIKVKSADFSVKGDTDYQVCSDIDGKCIPFVTEFTISGNK